MKNVIKLVLLVSVLLMSACSIKDETGPGEVHWDRDICARCVMAVSDHFFSAQIRGGAEGERTDLYFFDDLGCAVIWLDKQLWKDDPRTEIWVNDHESGDWIDASKAWYLTGKTTPMDYGLAAQLAKVEGALNYQEAVEEVYKREANPDRGCCPSHKAGGADLQ
jgi:copper chaperone NosL